VFSSNNIALTSDWHIPFHDEVMVERLFDSAREHGTKDIAIVGDFFDCDNVSKFNSITEADQTNKITFKGECKKVGNVLKRVLNVFDHVYICRGNHEKRWSDLNGGAVGVKQLFELALPGIEDGKWHDRITITSDDHMYLNQDGRRWLLCHPKNFRITPLSVARELAGKYLSDVFMAHGHGFCQGRDRSGNFTCLDGGGLFERAALEYTRETSCHPMTCSGYYILKEGKVIPYEGY
jgi:predicted phosphodiesterase